MKTKTLEELFKQYEREDLEKALYRGLVFMRREWISHSEAINKYPRKKKK